MEKGRGISTMLGGVLFLDLGGGLHGRIYIVLVHHFCNKKPRKRS